MISPPVTKKQFLLLFCGLLIAAAAAVPLDLAISRSAIDVPGDIAKLVTLSEVFAHGMGVAIIVLVVATLDVRGWRLIPRLACSAFGGGLLADIVKLLVARTRPASFDLENGHVRETFLGFLPSITGVAGADPFGHVTQSFPSGHTATAAGLAMGLSALYPRGRWLFFCLTALAASQRIVSHSHYLSDTLVGAALGLLAGYVMNQSDRLPGRWLNRVDATERLGT